MILWRISAFPDLSGRGGLFASGRWHRAGRPIVYLTETPASAMLEVLVHLEIDPEDVPEQLRLMRIHIPDALVTSQDALSLPDDWPERQALTQQIGDTWLEEGATALLRVPSAIMPHTDNWLFNPSHPLSGQATLSIETLQLDQRLFRRR
ncbi:RES family NAD+ phosphorylase [Castellaniella caeni]|uniref:RES family NAD+ phosphorylase n=1 Tax=Castellaniella caeni TaxID=266123 RepID=UPI000834BCDF|nr:RES family NAD+ phosphorylase [Castellaniella caeni]